jgi:hypothetical protein
MLHHYYEILNKATNASLPLNLGEASCLQIITIKLTPKYQNAADFISERKLLILAFIK